MKLLWQLVKVSGISILLIDLNLIMQYDAALELEQLRAMVQQIEYGSIKDMDTVHNGLLVSEPSKGR
jgi:hypothetical protein